MKTGIIRRLDDLGRMVIPKEMRDALKIKVGDAMEVHIDSEKKQVIFSVYESTPNYESMWNDLKKNTTISREVLEAIENQYKNS